MLICKARKDGNYTDNPILPKIDTPANAIFQITDTKLYDPIITLATENDKELLEQLKSGFKRFIKRNTYRSQMTIQSNNKFFNWSNIY